MHGRRHGGRPMRSDPGGNAPGWAQAVISTAWNKGAPILPRRWARLAVSCAVSRRIGALPRSRRAATVAWAQVRPRAAHACVASSNSPGGITGATAGNTRATALLRARLCPD